MENYLGDLRDTVRVPYPGDIIVFSATFEEHIENMRKVLGRVRDHGVKMNPQKCKLFKREVVFLGCVVSGGVTSWTRPVSSQFLQLPSRILF